jgi:hypothetical protein
LIKKEDPPEGTDRRGDLTRTRNLELPSEINLANRLNPVKDFYFLGSLRPIFFSGLFKIFSDKDF